MTRAPLDAYMSSLERELRRRFVIDPAILDEVRDHLVDAVDGEEARGVYGQEAWVAAVRRFGSPEAIAESFAAERTRKLHWWLFAVATVSGLLIAYVDSRPTWDDTGITAGAMLLAGALFGLLGPRRPWLWGLAVGIWIPLDALLRTPGATSAAMLLVLIFPLAGAGLGRYARRVLQGDVRPLSR